MADHEIEALAKEIITKVKTNQGFEKKLQLNLQKLVQKVQLDIVNTKKRADG